MLHISYYKKVSDMIFLVISKIKNPHLRFLLFLPQVVRSCCLSCRDFNHVLQSSMARASMRSSPARRNSHLADNPRRLKALIR